MEMRRFPLRASSGASLGQVVFISDRTYLEALERALAEREQMAELGELAAGMAHELRNALATIRGYLRLLPEADEARRERFVAAIEQEAGDAGRAPDRFLSFAEPRELRRGRCEVGAVLEEVAQRVRASFPGLDLRVADGAPVSCRRIAWPSGSSSRTSCATPPRPWPREGGVTVRDDRERRPPAGGGRGRRAGGEPGGERAAVPPVRLDQAVGRARPGGVAAAGPPARGRRRLRGAARGRRAVRPHAAARGVRRERSGAGRRGPPVAWPRCWPRRCVPRATRSRWCCAATRR